MSLRPEIVHNFETAVHDSFLRNLNYCAHESSSLENPEFTQCIKAAGINFNYSYQAFLNYKLNTRILSQKGMIE
jgi:hypothetical protein